MFLLLAFALRFLNATLPDEVQSLKQIGNSSSPKQDAVK